MAKCLVKDTRQRPSIETLAKHAFLRMHKDTRLEGLLKWAMGEDGAGPESPAASTDAGAAEAPAATEA